MKATEFRIGNLISVSKDGKNFSIIEITSIDGSDDFRMFLENSKPIPLTEEWLAKFGFKNRFDNKGHGAIWDLKIDDEHWDRNLCVALMEKGYKGAGGYVLNAPTCKAIAYVHQLQNLYFALTAEELTIKK